MTTTQINYTRKRALLACDFCRHRKRKCDGARPRCSTCVESNVDACLYQELPSDRLESPSPTAVAERLARMESLLEEQGQRLDLMLNLGFGISPGTTPGTGRGAELRGVMSTSLHPPMLGHSSSSANVSPQLLTSPASTSNRPGNPLDAHLEHTQFLIPQGHYASANSLLSCFPVRNLVGEYPRDYLFNLETGLSLPPPLDPFQGPLDHWPALDPDVLESLVHDYFVAVHPHFPLFPVQAFQCWQSQLFKEGPQDSLETAICLLVYALGCLVTPEESAIRPALQIEKDNLGLRFFRPALQFIFRYAVWQFRPSLALCQALLLSSSYFCHLARPLHSWKMAHHASRHFFHFLDGRKKEVDSNEYNDDELRVFWSCFMLECDRTAELDVVRSGIEPAADKMPLPGRLHASDTDETMHFVAEIAVRRLFNRIHSSLYSPENADIAALMDDNPSWTSVNLGKMLNLSSELNRQLESWYNSIPAEIRPPIGTAPIASDRGKVLRLQYYAAKHLIYRPFTLYMVLQQQGTSPSPGASMPGTPQPQYSTPGVILEHCEACIASCYAYLQNAGEMLDERSPYLWTLAQGCFVSLLVLLLARRCPKLRPFAPDVEHLQAAIIAKLQRWAVAGSSIQAETSILENVARSY